MKLDTTISICVTIISLVAILGITIYHINDRFLMSKNIQDAISKGIDPISVRCSYTKESDAVCVTFASKPKDFMLQSNINASSIKK